MTGPKADIDDDWEDGALKIPTEGDEVFSENWSKNAHKYLYDLSPNDASMLCLHLSDKSDATCRLLPRLNPTQLKDASSAMRAIWLGTGVLLVSPEFTESEFGSFLPLPAAPTPVDAQHCREVLKSVRDTYGPSESSTGAERTALGLLDASLAMPATPEEILATYPDFAGRITYPNSSSGRKRTKASTLRQQTQYEALQARTKFLLSCAYFDWAKRTAN